MCELEIFREICQKFLIYTLKEHFTLQICQRKFGHVSGDYMYVSVIY